MAELRFCKPAVVGSTPTASSVLKPVMAKSLRQGDDGGVPERPMGPDCKSGGNAFTGSNPVAPTRFTAWMRPRGRTACRSCLPVLLSNSPVRRQPRKRSEELAPRPVQDRGCSSMVEFQPSKLATWVRFPSPALSDDLWGSAAVAQLVECVLGKDEVLGSNPSSSLPVCCR